MPFDEVGIAVDTPVFVRMDEGDQWQLRYFKCFDNSGVECFYDQKKSTEANRGAYWPIYSFEIPS